MERWEWLKSLERMFLWDELLFAIDSRRVIVLCGVNTAIM